VVSLPATREHDDEEAETRRRRASPVDVGLDQAVTMSSVGFLPRSSAIAIAYMISFHRRLRGIDVGVIGILPPGHLVGPQRNSLSRSSLPCRLTAQQAGRWPVAEARTPHCSTKSPEPSDRRRFGDVLGAVCQLVLQAGRSRGGRKATGDDLCCRAGCGAGALHVEHDACCAGISDVLARLSPGLGACRDQRPFSQIVQRKMVAAARHLLDVGMLAEQQVAVVLEAAAAAGQSTPVDGFDSRSWQARPREVRPIVTSGSRKSKSAGILGVHWGNDCALSELQPCSRSGQ